MAWVAVDRAVRTLEHWPDLDGPLEKWRALRDQIFTQVCAEGYNASVGAFTQYYGSDQMDASVLMIPLVGFLPATDPRVVSTVEAVERELLVNGFVLRYKTTDDGAVDGLTGREGAFLACSFWLVDCLHMIGRTQDAEDMFERLLSVRNELGLLSEEYDTTANRLVGNFPQAFSHVSLVNSAYRLTGVDPLATEPDIVATVEHIEDHDVSTSPTTAPPARKTRAGVSPHSTRPHR
jgi:GH15 family glucan-1,4-alpha-glucosidase